MSTRAPPTAPESPIPVALAAVFAGIAVLATMLAVAYRTPVPLAIAAPFGLSASLVWYHATGRLHRRVRRNAFAGGRFGGGRTVGGDRGSERTRHRATAGRARAGDPRREGGAGRRRRFAGATGDRYGGQRPPADHAAMSRAEAYETLDLDPDADADAVQAAYRRRVKEAHPDVEGGDREEFRAVVAAYERLDGE